MTLSYAVRILVMYVTKSFMQLSRVMIKCQSLYKKNMAAHRVQYVPPYYVMYTNEKLVQWWVIGREPHHKLAMVTLKWVKVL